MMRLTVRLHTPPLTFCSFQYIWLACVSGCASGENTPDRSVRTPSVIVLSVTPGPVLIDPAPDEEVPPEVSSPLLPQPLAATNSRAAARPAAPIRNDRVMQCSLQV